MIKPLRKRHLQIWMAWAVLLPTGIISGWLVIPKPATGKLVQPAASAALPIIFKKTEKPNYTVALRHSADNSAWQLEWINKGVLNLPSATVYKATPGDSGIQKNLLIGRIEARGTYHFALDTLLRPVNQWPYQLYLYDFIHQQIIDTINFQP